MSHAFKPGHLRNKIGSKPDSPSPSTALDSDGFFSIAASSLSIMPSFAAAIAGATSIVTVFAELMTGHFVRHYCVTAGASDATLSASKHAESIVLMRRFERFSPGREIVCTNLPNTKVLCCLAFGIGGTWFPRDLLIDLMGFAAKCSNNTPAVCQVADP